MKTARSFRPLTEEERNSIVSMKLRVVKSQLKDLELEVGVLRDYARARP